MGIEIKIIAADGNDAIAQLRGLLEASAVGPQTLPPVNDTASLGKEAPKPTTARKSAKKAEEAPAAPEADPTPATPPQSVELSEDAAPSPTAEASNEAQVVDYKMVQDAVVQLAAKRGRSAVLQVYEVFGVDHGSKLKESQWAAAYDALVKAREEELA